MTKQSLEAQATAAAFKCELAAKVRAILDEAKKAYGPKQWDEDDIDTKVSSLVFDDD